MHGIRINIAFHIVHHLDEPGKVRHRLLWHCHRFTPWVGIAKSSVPSRLSYITGSALTWPPVFIWSFLKLLVGRFGLTTMVSICFLSPIPEKTTIEQANWSYDNHPEVVLARLSHRGLLSRNLKMRLDLRDRRSLLSVIFSPTSSYAYACAFIR